MQSDTSLDESLRKSSAWVQDEVTGKTETELQRIAVSSLERAAMSFSGHERNHLFMNRNGESFDDVSGISGLNVDADSRSFAIVDFDRDGWQDIVLANVTSPSISFFRNQLGDIASNSENRRLVVDCIGGNDTADKSAQFGNRDGYGAVVKIFVNDEVLVREKRCGEGLAAQNSQLLHFGLGSNTLASKIEIRWPSGLNQQIENVPAGSLVRAFEDTSQTSDPTGFELTKMPESVGLANRKSSDETLSFRPAQAGNARHQIYVSMATWCPNCKKHLPQLNLLRRLANESELDIVGVPIDGSDSDVMLSKYLIENKPPYELSGKWAQHDREEFARIIGKTLEFDSLPATVLTDEKGQVLNVFAGVPTLSELAKAGVRFGEATNK